MPRLFYVLTEDWFFHSHFLERAIAASRNGYEVTVVAREGMHAEIIRKAGLRFLPFEFRRRGLNPLVELWTTLALSRLYRRERPDIVHHVALKPILYGTIAALLTGCKHIVNAPVGMGFLFTSRSLLAKALRPVVGFAMKRLLNPRGSFVIFENKDDMADAVNLGMVSKLGAVLIRGAGIDVKKYPRVPEPPAPIIVSLAARMLWDKGIREYVEASELLRRRGIDICFQLIGAPDDGNPASIPSRQLEQWHAAGLVRWLGQRQDVMSLLAASHIACLPSYREGLPKFLLEALAVGRPVIATDVPGCREAVRHGENGLLVPAANPHALADAIAKLAADKALRMQFADASRARAEKEFSSAQVIAATVRVYERFTIEASH